jgi:hypothetical protein
MVNTRPADTSRTGAMVNGGCGLQVAGEKVSPWGKASLLNPETASPR